MRIEIEQCRLGGVFAAEAQQLLRQTGSAFSGAEDLAD
jgi:hypothetical protein